MPLQAAQMGKAKTQRNQCLLKEMHILIDKKINTWEEHAICATDSNNTAVARLQQLKYHCQFQTCPKRSYQMSFGCLISVSPQHN